MNKLLKKPPVLLLFLVVIPTILLMLTLSDSPLFSITAFFTGPFTNFYTFLNMITKMTPLLLTSLGAFIALKSNAINLGGEGQVYLGATLTAILLTYFNINSILLLIPVILLVLLATGLITYISAILENKYRVSSLISTYLFSMGIIHTCNYLITGPFLMKGSNILTTQKIPESLQMDSLFIPALIITILISLIYKYSIIGYEFRISGRNRVFANSMGIKSDYYRISGLTISGMLHGLAGVLLVIGNHHSAIYGFHTGLGWNGLSSALIAGEHPLMVIVSSLLFSYLDSGASYATITSDVTLELSTIIKSILFFVISSKIIKEQLIKKGDKC